MTASPAVPAVPAVPLARVRAQDLAPYPIDIEFPDLERFRRGSTPVGHVHVFDSAQPGPTVMLNALTHGNEVCGAVALATLLDARIRPRRGRLIVSFANVQAYARFDANDPDRARFVDEDFNRVWSPAQLDGPRRSADLDRAREIRPFVDDADFLLDLHSMHEACAPVMVCGPLDKGAALARRLGTPECLIQDEGHAQGVRMRDYAAFGDVASAKAALLIECGQHWERNAARVALDACARFLLATDAVDHGDIDPAWLLELPARQTLVKVSDAIVTAAGRFEFARDWKGLETLAAGTLIGWDDGAPVVAPYDNCVLVMPSLRQARPGVTVVRLGRVQ